MLGVAIVVLVIGHGSGDPFLGAFESAARGALGGDASIQIIKLDSDPPDEESRARAGAVDGIVELSWTADGSKSTIHCYLSREQRWLDREIVFGAAEPASTREARERGRLLGFAVATMFSEAPAPPLAQASGSQAPREPQANAPSQAAKSVGDVRRSLEFSGQMSSGLEGTAAGVGAGAALRWAMYGPVWARLFIAGRTGNIAPAQATTQNALFGGGIALMLPVSRFEFGIRSDFFANYFAVTHLSQDDVKPDRRSRWLPGADLLGEAGFHLTGSAAAFAGAGIEAVLGKTEIFTHGERAAVVSPVRAVGEIGFRIAF